MEIDFLANHPDFINTLAPLLVAHWRPVLSQETLESRATKLRAHMNIETLPVAWVAYSGTTVLGTAALRTHDLPDHEQLTPWLGGVFVVSQYRRQGVGTALCSTVEQYAKNRFGISTLYLFTIDKQEWYKSLGWSLFESCTWCGRPGDIMFKELNHAISDT